MKRHDYTKPTAAPLPSDGDRAPYYKPFMPSINPLAELGYMEQVSGMGASPYPIKHGHCYTTRVIGRG